MPGPPDGFNLETVRFFCAQPRKTVDGFPFEASTRLILFAEEIFLYGQRCGMFQLSGNQESNFKRQLNGRHIVSNQFVKRSRNSLKK